MLEKYPTVFDISGDFFLLDPQITKVYKNWLYAQIIQAIKKVKNCIIFVFSPIKLPSLINYK